MTRAQSHTLNRHSPNRAQVMRTSPRLSIIAAPSAEAPPARALGMNSLAGISSGAAEHWENTFCSSAVHFKSFISSYNGPWWWGDQANGSLQQSLKPVKPFSILGGMNKSFTWEPLVAPRKTSSDLFWQWGLPLLSIPIAPWNWYRSTCTTGHSITPLWPPKAETAIQLCVPVPVRVPSPRGALSLWLGYKRSRAFQSITLLSYLRETPTSRVSREWTWETWEQASPAGQLEGPVLVMKMIEGDGDDSVGDNDDRNFQNCWALTFCLAPS